MVFFVFPRCSITLHNSLEFLKTKTPILDIVIIETVEIRCTNNMVYNETFCIKKD